MIPRNNNCSEPGASAVLWFAMALPVSMRTAPVPAPEPEVEKPRAKKQIMRQQDFKGTYAMWSGDLWSGEVIRLCVWQVVCIQF